MSNYVQKCIELCEKKNPGEVEFHQTVEEVLTSLVPVIEKHPEYEKVALLERLTEPERGITFRVVWTDDNGNVQVNKGYKYQFNSVLGTIRLLSGTCRRLISKARHLSTQRRCLTSVVQGHQ